MVAKITVVEDEEALAALLARAGSAPRQPALAALHDALIAARDLPFEEGVAVEAEKLTELVRSDQSAALRHLFFAERAAARIPGTEAASAGAPIRPSGASCILPPGEDRV